MAVRTRRILLTGAGGQLGRELRTALSILGEVTGIARRDLDLSDTTAIQTCVRSIRPDLIVNAAAYTRVDQAEVDSKRAMAVNGVAPGTLAEEAASAGVPTVHYSTDYVFDGRSTIPYRELDAPAPQNVYGATKLTGEQAIAATGADHLILRTSWLYGAHGENFVRTILRLAREREELAIVADQVGAPTWCRVLAQYTAAALAQCQTAEGFRLSASQGGVFHLSAAGKTTWHAFAEAILVRDPTRQDQRVRQLRPITSAEYPTAATRPHYSILDNSRARRAFGLAMPDWASQLDAFMQEASAWHACRGRL